MQAQTIGQKKGDVLTSEIDPIGSVVCVTVTYGDRSHYIKAMVERLSLIGVGKLVVVDNGSKERSASALKELAIHQIGINIVLLRHDANLGSAEGFHVGLAYAKDKLKEDFIWLLDDDNLPQPDALKALFQAYRKLSIDQELVCLQSIRKPGMQSVHTVTLLQPRNNFLGFHFPLIMSKVAERIDLKTKKQSPKEEIPIKIDAVPYGGFFFPRKCFNVIGLPDPSYTLYMDDFEYTNRVVTKGGSIWLIPTSIVDDVEQSHHVQTAKKPLLYHSTLDTAQEFKVYYTVRNMIYFYEKHYGANAIIYYINQFILMTFLQVSALLRGKQSRLKLVKQAIKDGKEGKMGTRYELP